MTGTCCLEGFVLGAAFLVLDEGGIAVLMEVCCGVDTMGGGVADRDAMMIGAGEGSR